ncbi:ABC transporter substrate binding protein precursor [Desulfovibrio sp. X2]|uniref:ABC transporter substrate-binding protein n=1 Tax=Desulfovibrio sp. X2 TaxID=941449 RepID=UPI000358984B|nr:ABC transporter substrate-binding protein [Desulfovibrio sp. X2]EPR42805.1 ABC transporter substrate binding protein precursor [Desulfovibrio sp. X2]
MSKRLITFLVAVLAMALFAVPAFASDSVKIAVAAPFTGAAAPYGDNVKAGVQIKVDEINAAGGINGKKLEVEWMDEQCDPKEAATVAPKIVENKEILGVVGHVCSSAHLAALPFYVRGGIVAISPTATNPSISEKNKDRAGKVWSFRNVYRDDFQGIFMARYAKEALGLKAVGVFYENNDYGIGLKDSFVNEAKKIGLKIVGEEAYVKGAQDFTPQLTKFKEAHPDGIFIAGYYGEGALIAAQAKKLGMDVVKMGADGLDNGDYIKLARAAANNTYLSVPFLQDVASPAAKAFVAKFKETYKRDADYMSVNAYDATGILAEAIAKAGPDRAKIRDYIAGINAEHPYMGIGGKTVFDAKGDCQKPAFVKMVKDEKFVAAPKQMN